MILHDAARVSLAGDVSKQIASLAQVGEAVYEAVLLTLCSQRSGSGCVAMRWLAWALPNVPSLLITANIKVAEDAAYSMPLISVHKMPGEFAAFCCVSRPSDWTVCRISIRCLPIARSGYYYTAQPLSFASDHIGPFPRPRLVCFKGPSIIISIHEQYCANDLIVRK